MRFLSDPTQVVFPMVLPRTEVARELRAYVVLFECASACDEDVRLGEQ